MAAAATLVVPHLSVTPISAVYASNVPPKTPLTVPGTADATSAPLPPRRPSNGGPIYGRSRLNENYEAPASGREGWWRATIKETPAPGAYESVSSLKDVLERPNTYRFKTDGRKREPHPQIGRGVYLLPGAYNSTDFIESVQKMPGTYRFKDTSRNDRDMMTFGLKDKDINVSPGNYDNHTYQNMSVEKESSRHFMFRSQSQRFPTIPFKPKDGPAPGLYESNSTLDGSTVVSSFMSKTPRFNTSHTKVPGPGSYEKTCQAPIPKTILKMGRQNGIFFSSAFQV